MPALNQALRMSHRDLADALTADETAIVAFRAPAKAVSKKFEVWNIALAICAAVVCSWCLVSISPAHNGVHLFGAVFLGSMFGMTVSMLGMMLIHMVFINKYSRLAHRLTPLCERPRALQNVIEFLKNSPSALAYRDACVAKGRQLYVVDYYLLEELAEEETAQTLCRRIHHDDFSTPAAGV